MSLVQTFEGAYNGGLPTVAVLFAGNITASMTIGDFYAATNQLTILVKVLGVSGTSPSLTINVYPVDPANNQINSAIGTATITSIADTVINVNLYGLRHVRVTASVSGTSPSFTVVISALG